MADPRSAQTDHGKEFFERFVDLWNSEADFPDAPEFIADDFTMHSAELARYLGFPDFRGAAHR